MSNSLKVKTNTIKLLIFCWLARGPCAATEFNLNTYGNVQSTWNFGQEETYVDNGFGLEKYVDNKNYRHYKFNLDGDASLTVNRLQFRFTDHLSGDVYSVKDQISRNSNYQNYASFEGDYFIHDNVRVKGVLNYDIFEDQSFPEFSSDEFSARLEIEKKLRRDAFLTVGYEARDLDFSETPLDSYIQKDVFINFYRFSPEKNTFKYRREARQLDQEGALKKDMFHDSTRDYLGRMGLNRTASMIPLVDLSEQIDIYEPYQIQSNMTFELDSKIRYRELSNALEKSYLEAQVNGVVQFFFDSEHHFSIENHYSDRDYAEESLANNLLHFQRNEALLSHYLAVNRFVFDHRLSIDQYFYKNRPSWDSMEWELNSGISYDILRRWNLSYYNSWSKVSYELPRQFFTNHEHSFHSFSWSYKFSNKFSFKSQYDSESKIITFFENSIDSSFHKKAQDHRLQYDSNKLFGFHAGYKWERERHNNYEINDRYEQMTYVGASIKI